MHEQQTIFFRKIEWALKKQFSGAFLAKKENTHKNNLGKCGEHNGKSVDSTRFPKHAGL
jgi:hypothetical protein